MFSTYSFSPQSSRNLMAKILVRPATGISIKYPFWQLDEETTSAGFCGYPGFGLNCSNSSQDPVLKLPKTSYFVHEIDYDNLSLNLIHTDVGGEENDCPRVQQNFTVENLPIYQTTSDLNLTFYYNCSGPPPMPATPIFCLESKPNKSSYVFESTLLFERWYEFCEERVDVAVLKDGIVWGDGVGMINDFRRALREGFSLRWEMLEDCRESEKSEGRCGFNNTSKDSTIGTDDQHCRGSSSADKDKKTKTSASTGNKNNPGVIIIFVAVGAVVGGSILLLLLLFIYHAKSAKSLFSNNVSSNPKDVEAFISQYGSSIPQRFQYCTLKKITNSFKYELGKGGYGNVYRGNLADGRVVAVKVLHSSKGNGEDFMNEVASIGRTSHVNVVTLLGYCYEGKRRALIYEFMPNGSLEKFIYGTNSSLEGQHLGWEKLYSIAIGIARGLEYLHRGCNTRILHFDIKPHNILLDEYFCPKISDFGLAKLYNTKESVVSSLLHARGTIGYIAPEVISRNFGQVSHKSDVYSYGMMILEMVGGRKNVDPGVDHTSAIYYPRWLYQRIQYDDVLNMGTEISKEENELVRKMVIVGLWCIQIHPSQRPSMGKVIEMLERQISALEMPPSPYLCSAPSSPSNLQTKLE